MSDSLHNLFIPYTAGDSGTRPLPSGTVFWVSPGLHLDTAHGAVDASTYTIGTPCGIVVEVQNSNGYVAYDLIHVEVWVSDPSTVMVPGNALTPAQGLPPHSVLKGGAASSGTVTKIPVSGFVPYAGMSSLAGGHVCLVANCWSDLTGQVDGSDLLTTSGVNLSNRVQDDKHAAQRNLFAAAAAMHQHRPFEFEFLAATPLAKGHEQVVLEIQNPTGHNALPAGDLAFLKQGPFGHLPLRISDVPLKTFKIHGSKDDDDDDRHGKYRRSKLELHAGKPVRLRIEAEFGQGEAIGNVHVFEVIQSAAGKAQGGLRVLAVIAQ